MKRITLAAALVLVPLLMPAHAADTEKSNPAYMWDLSDLYSSPDAWTAARDKAMAAADKLESYKGTLGKSAADMLTALDAISAVHKEADRLGVYASLKADEDVRIAANQERQQLAQAVATTLGEKTSWLTPEILSVGADKVKSFEAASPDLKRRFGFFLDNVLRAAPHTLGAEAEGVMAAAGNVLAQPDNIYSQLSNGELPFPTVTLSDGTKVRLDQSAYTKYRQAPLRADRKKVFDAFWGTWKSYEGTFGASLNTQVLGEEFDANVRHFPNALSDALFADNMPEGVYRQLVAQANAGLPAFYRYLKLRKKLLGIKDELQYYDMYPSMFTLAKPLHFSVADAERIGLDVTSVYGPEYTAMLKKGFSGRWMDVLPRQGKAAGAYMNGSAYDVHPYLHLNHNYDYESLSTFVHEWGHAVHTLLDDETQPYETSNYSTFIAETASISNEMLLNDYMVAHAKSKAEKLYYLGQGLELIRTTFFRQTMFGEFQLAIHEEVEKGHALSGKRMTDIYCGLLKRYYGDAEGAMKVNPAYCVEWAFIPHFYYGFYVYQYATSMAGAAAFTQAIEHNDPGVRERFIAMLKAGGSDYPYDLYKKAGFDMASPAPYQALVARMNHLMDEIDALEK
ncbi:MAG: oligoendopeptidase F family protein [Alphaproteobacteria bacterium]|nr:oligoendopeptidase F family protein [Alphaproteobacteria bacterium]MDE2109855.1 oligoendopeptidase F family protein [Alphaproteobacteria bacterium]MDE2493539.1 oligoendopeptidase F family protein [Alphaproteobacteria bacterium]